jgi:hypothetical protein
VSERPPEAALWDALRGGLVTRALGLVAELDIARLLGEEARPVAELAAASGADPDTLQRLLRALASDGIFAEEEPGSFRNTPVSQLLTVDGWDDFARLFGSTWLHGVGGLDTSVEASFPRVFGDEFWAWLGAHPAERASFDRAMAQGWRGAARAARKCRLARRRDGRRRRRRQRLAPPGAPRTAPRDAGDRLRPARDRPGRVALR